MRRNGLDPQIAAGATAEEKILTVLGKTVVFNLDTTIDDSLLQEGLARELVNRVQNLRKAANLDVSDRIELSVTCPEDGPLSAAMAQEDLRALVQGETLATSLYCNAEVAFFEFKAADEEIDGVKIKLKIGRSLNSMTPEEIDALKLALAVKRESQEG